MDFSWWLIIAAIITGGIWAANTYFLSRQEEGGNDSGVELEQSEKKEPALVEISRFMFQLIVLVLLIQYFLSANINFALVLVLAVVITGAIWGIDALFFAKQRQLRSESEATANVAVAVKEPVIVELSRFLFPVVLVVLVLRSFIAEPFKIPSGSMLPTLEVGDFIIVNKFSYGIRLPVLNTKVIDLGSPQRGDVIVFRYPENPSIDYIKRVIGIPGDKIGYYNKVLYVNGKPAPQQHTGTYVDGYDHINRYQEDLTGVKHDILINYMAPANDSIEEVPENMYFVMGDNRDNSRDSRVWGFVPDENLVGKANFIWMNWDCTMPALFKWGCSMPKWSRIGTGIE